MKFKIGEYFHKYRGKCEFTDSCFFLQSINPDSTSVFMEFNGEIEEVSKCFIFKSKSVVKRERLEKNCNHEMREVDRDFDTIEYSCKCGKYWRVTTVD